MPNLFWQVSQVFINPLLITINTWSVLTTEFGIPAPNGGEDSQRLAGVTWGHSSFNAGAPSPAPTSQGTCRWSSRERMSHAGGHPTKPTTSSFSWNTPISANTAPLSPTTSSCQKLHPLSPNRKLTRPPAPFLSPPRSLPPRPPSAWGRPHSVSASSNPFSSVSFSSRPAVPTRPAHGPLTASSRSITAPPPTQPGLLLAQRVQLPGAAEAALRGETETLTLGSGPYGCREGSWGEARKSCIPLPDSIPFLVEVTKTNQ